MISKTEISRDLNKLNGLFDAETDRSKELFFAKLAIIELSSWIEQSLDAIARRAIKNRLTTSKFEGLAEKAINDNYGFKYKENFMPMLGRLAGFEACESLEEHLRAASMFDVLTSELSILTEQRNLAAHVGIRHATYDAPSVTIGRFSKLYPIIKRMYAWSVWYCP